jgi:hypothetical protein
MATRTEQEGFPRTETTFVRSRPLVPRATVAVSAVTTRLGPEQRSDTERTTTAEEALASARTPAYLPAGTVASANEAWRVVFG